MLLIIGLIIAALVLISFEIVAPGGILGVLGAVAVIAAAAVAYDEYGLIPAVFTLIASVVVIGVMVVVEFKMLEKTKYGKQLFLHKTSGGRIRYGQRSDDGPEEDSLVGQQGEAVTAMAPSGRVLVGGKSYEGFSQSGFLNKGESVEVVGRDAFRIVVKKIS